MDSAILCGDDEWQQDEQDEIWFHDGFNRHKIQYGS
jgi:hypothetical protein